MSWSEDSVVEPGELIKSSAKAGFEAVASPLGKVVLSNAGKALLESISPELKSFFFKSGPSEDTILILKNINELHIDLNNRLDVILDEIKDGFTATIEADIYSANTSFLGWAETDSLFRRVTNNQIPTVGPELNNVRRRIQTFILEDSDDIDNQLDRLELLQLHIGAAQSSVMGYRAYYGSEAIYEAWSNDPDNGQNNETFNGWAEAITESDLKELTGNLSEFKSVQNEIYQDTLDFYDLIANQPHEGDYFKKFIEEKFTPIVSQEHTLKYNPDEEDLELIYDDPAIVTDENRWAVKDDWSWPGYGGNAGAILDGFRWYYYVDIPSHECLDGYAPNALAVKSSEPWSEVEEDPAQSNCNRFWILSPDSITVPVDGSSSNLPEFTPYLGSFDGYEIIFEDPYDIYELHKELVEGHLVREYYGASSLVLDEMYAELNNGALRPDNNWDTILDEFEALRFMLAETESISGEVRFSDGEIGNDVIDGGAGNNFILGRGGNDVIHGQEGADFLLGGLGDDHITGGGGDDRIDGGKGNDELSGDSGNPGEDIVFGGSGNDIIGGGGNDDELYGESGDDVMRGDSSRDVRGVWTEPAPGSEGDDFMDGGDGDDEMYGEAGNDTLKGGEGNDSLFGGIGNDTLEGGSGTNTLAGQLGDDTYIIENSIDIVQELQGEGIDSVYSSVNYTISNEVENLYLTGTEALIGIGNNEDNQIVGNDEDNELKGQGGNDSIDGGIGNDTLEGNQGDDQLLGGLGNDILNGHEGSDILDGGSGDDQMNGGVGDDFYIVDSSGDTVIEFLSESESGGFDHIESSVDFSLIGIEVEELTFKGEEDLDGDGNGLDNKITGNTGDNVIKGGDGNDTLSGQEGDDHLMGEAGDDLLIGGQGNDILDGGDGFDIVSNPEATGPMIRDMQTGLSMGSSSEDIWIDIEGALLSPFNDIARGDDEDNYFDGLAGNDVIEGRGGNDEIEGGEGSDRLKGGDGDDTLKGGDGNDVIDGDDGHDLLQGDAGNDVLDAGNGNDQLFGGDGDDILEGDEGNDNLEGDAGIDTLLGGEGNDTLNGGDNNDLLSGDAGDDNLSGGNGDDILDGFIGRDTLNGDAGNDFLSSGDGNDTLDGGEGDDVLDGGEGDDTFKLGDGEDIATGGGDNDTFEITKQEADGAINNLPSVPLTSDDLSSIDLNNPGDGLLTLDSTTELKWLDLGETLGRTIADGEIPGFRFATFEEVNNLFNRLPKAEDNPEELSVSSLIFLFGGVDSVDVDILSGLVKLDDGSEQATTFGCFATSPASEAGCGGGLDRLDLDESPSVYASWTGVYMVQADGSESIPSDPTVTITDFTGIGQGTSPSQEILEELDVLKFSGEGLTPEAMQLKQIGNDLEITFEGVANTRVLLQGVSLEDIDNLPNQNGKKSGGFGNILFNGQTEIQDDFDVVNSDKEEVGLFNRNTVTFLNSLNNKTVGFDDSNDVINALGGDDILEGLSGNDLLRGGDGNDLLIGGEGDDLLQGDAGADIFAFQKANQGIDILADFSSAEGDIIQISAAGFDGELELGVSSADHFALGAASDADDRFIYDQSTGILSFDSDGIGLSEATQIASLNIGTAISYEDILVV